jgi:phenylpropionate dioxygenase-like ring-hydroxylating dioxygenase large terminal subunit
VSDEWVVVARSDDLAPGATLADDEHDVVAWRGTDGIVCVVDSRCPHQWSHLAAEGAVDGDELVCTAHFWRFDRNGRGTKLNVNGRRDAKSDVTVYECREAYGVIEARTAHASEPFG